MSEIFWPSEWETVGMQHDCLKLHGGLCDVKNGTQFEDRFCKHFVCANSAFIKACDSSPLLSWPFSHSTEHKKKHCRQSCTHAGADHKSNSRRLWAAVNQSVVYKASLNEACRHTTAPYRDRTQMSETVTAFPRTHGWFKIQDYFYSRLFLFRVLS